MRMVVGFEGKTTIDGRYIMPGALRPLANQIVVTAGSCTRSDCLVLGNARDFERNEDTGELSFDIISDVDLSKVNVHMEIGQFRADDSRAPLTIHSGVIREIYFSPWSFAWVDPALRSEHVG